MSKDTIYREDAIKAIEDRRYWLTLASQRGDMGHVLWDEYYIKFEDAIDALLLIPSADRPQGEWIQKPHKVYLPRDCEPLFEETYNEADHSTIEYWWYCNQCDYEADRSFKPTFKFCPSCGCRIKGADDFVKTHEVVANGNCAICGKPLSGDRVFVCEECNNKGYVLFHQKVKGADDGTR